MCQWGGGGTGRDGIKGSSKIMIFIFYIAVSPMAHVLFVCVYYTLLVVIIICTMFVKLRKC